MTLSIPPTARCRKSLLSLATASLLCLPQLVLAQNDDPIKAIEEQTDRWIELETRIARERNQWKTDRQLLKNSIDLLHTENRALQSMLESNQSASKVLLRNLDSLQSTIEENEAGLAALQEPLDRFEARLNSLAPQLPDPLRAEVTSLLAKVKPAPDKPKVTPSTRVQTLVSVLAAIDKFNNSLTVANSTRPDPNGGEVSVRVLYWGLAAGFALDRANQRAWTVSPTEEGWTWSEANQAYLQIADLFQLYESDVQDPRLVLLPMNLK